MQFDSWPFLLHKYHSFSSTRKNLSYNESVKFHFISEKLLECFNLHPLCHSFMFAYVFPYFFYVCLYFVMFFYICLCFPCFSMFTYAFSMFFLCLLMFPYFFMCLCLPMFAYVCLCLLLLPVFAVFAFVCCHSCFFFAFALISLHLFRVSFKFVYL